MQNTVAYPIESVGNALRLLHLLRSSDEVRVTEVAHELGVAPSTAHRLMAMLVQYGFAEQNTRRAYEPGWALRGELHPPPAENFVTLAHPHLEQLSRRLGETVHLVRLEGTAAVFVDGVEPIRRATVHVRSRAGMSMLAHCTASGKAILACLPPAEVAAMFPRGLPRTYGPGPTDLTTLHRQLGRIRRKGFSVNDEESERGLVGIGACVIATSGRPIGSVATGIPLQRCPDRLIPTIAEELLATARAVETSLRCRPTAVSA